MRKVLVAALMSATALAACGEKQPDVIVVPAASDGGGGDYGPPQTAEAPTPAPDAATPAAEGATPAVTNPAPAGDKPVRKPGLWQITSTNERGPQSGSFCVSAATEDRRGAFAMIGGGGQRPGVGGQGGVQGAGPGGGQRPGGDAAGGERRAQGGPGGGGGGGFGGGARTPCPEKITRTADGWTASSSCTREMGDATVKTSTRQTLTGDLAVKYTVKGTRTVSGSPREGANGAHPISITATYKGACPAGMKAGDYKGSDGEVRNLLQGGGRN